MIMNGMNLESDKPLWQLTVGEFMELINMIPKNVPESITLPAITLPERRLVYGISGIAQLFNCSMATANRIKSSGKIDRAISQYGRMITVDADLALELLNKQ
jgi:hypothetical protein